MQPLDPGIVRVWTVVGAVTTAPLWLASLLVLGLTGGHVVGWALLALAVTAATVLAGVVPRLRYRYLRWGIEDGIVRVHQGWLWRQEAAVPVFRIQHIDLQQGPLDRWAGLQQLTVHTAAPAARVDLPGVAASDAEGLRTHLLELAREAVREHGLAEDADAV